MYRPFFVVCNSLCANTCKIVKISLTALFDKIPDAFSSILSIILLVGGFVPEHAHLPHKVFDISPFFPLRQGEFLTGFREPGTQYRAHLIKAALHLAFTQGCRYSEGLTAGVLSLLTHGAHTLSL